MRAAIIGSGFIARVHATALRAIGVEIVAISGRTAAGAEAFGEGRAYDDLAALLEREQIDALHVCTPNAVHAAPALAAIERGIHVVCEKPLALSTDETRAMIAAAEARRVVHATCYHVRGYPLVEQMRVDVAEGVVGAVSFVHGRYLCDDVLFPTSGWRVDPARSAHSSCRRAPPAGRTSCCSNARGRRRGSPGTRRRRPRCAAGRPTGRRRSW